MRIIDFRLAGIIVSVIALPLAIHAYGQGPYYSEGAYYSQTTYYSQGSYQSTYNNVISRNTSVVGSFTALGTLSKGSGTFVIDHPLDPKNKLLYHSFVESPDVKNMYDGIATLDARGEAVVTLPHYFDALNTAVRYQLKPIGEPQPDLHVAGEIEANRFTIGGGKPNARVSWQITGTRKDAYILAHPIKVEVEKRPDAVVDRGEFYFPDHALARGFPTKPVAERLRALIQ